MCSIHALTWPTHFFDNKCGKKTVEYERKVTYTEKYNEGFGPFTHYLYKYLQDMRKEGRRGKGMQTGDARTTGVETK